MPTRTVALDESQWELITRLVASGRYQSADEVVQEGLRLVERQESEKQIRLMALRQAVDVGIADIKAGRYRTFERAESLRSYLSTVSAEVHSGPASHDDTLQ